MLPKEIFPWAPLQRRRRPDRSGQAAGNGGAERRAVASQVGHRPSRARIKLESMLLSGSGTSASSQEDTPAGGRRRCRKSGTGAYFFFLPDLAFAMHALYSLLFFFISAQASFFAAGLAWASAVPLMTVPRGTQQRRRPERRWRPSSVSPACLCSMCTSTDRTSVV